MDIYINAREIVMNGSFRQSMSWLHTWAGLVLGTVLYFIFITGSVGYFDDEITYWMQPEIPSISASVDQNTLLIKAEKQLSQVAANAANWFIKFPTGRTRALSISWKNPPNEITGKASQWQQEILDPLSGKPVITRQTGGGDKLYQMHYALHYMPRVWGYWISSLAALFMLVALITGIVIHKKIFKEFFTFRPGKKQRSWLDMHNILSVLPLPFHLMITYSGLILLMFTTMQGVMTASYGAGKENRERFYDVVFSEGVEHKNTAGITAKNITLTTLLSKTETRWGKNQISSIHIKNRGDINSYIEVTQQGNNGLNHGQSLILNAKNGELQLISGEHEATGNAIQLYELMRNLHEGLFAGTALRWLYFISSLMGAGMIATGMILWAAKRREKANKNDTAGYELILVEYLNIGTIVGLPIAIAAYLWANRLIPTGLKGRDQWEIHSLFICWALMLFLPFLLAKKYSLRQLWVGELAIATIVFALLPVINIFTTDKYLSLSLSQNDWVMVSFDLSLWIFALGFGIGAYKLRCKDYKNQPNDQASRPSFGKSNAASIKVTP